MHASFEKRTELIRIIEINNVSLKKNIVITIIIIIVIIIIMHIMKLVLESSFLFRKQNYTSKQGESILTRIGIPKLVVQ